MSRKLIKEEHFRNLSKFCSSNQNNDDLHEYFQFLLNKNEENLDKDFFKKHKKCINDLNSNEIRKENENAFINKNQYHCEFCKISYFDAAKGGDNAQVEIKPKCYLSYQNAKLLTKYKLNRMSKTYNSYKDRLVKRIVKTSFRIYYKCRRCKSNNLIFKERKRNNLEKIKLLTTRTSVKNVKNRYDLLINKSKQLTTDTTSTTTTTNGGVKKQKNFYRNLKFQSLKLAAAAENDSKKKSVEINFNLNDFLEKIK